MEVAVWVGIITTRKIRNAIHIYTTAGCYGLRGGVSGYDMLTL